MLSFLSQNTIAVTVGAISGITYQFFSTEPNQLVLIAVLACGFLGAHLPSIQQPTLFSYRLLRGASWLTSLLIPITLFFYRPTDLIPALIVTLIFTSGFWSIIDRISLQRDFTRSISGIIIFPVMITSCTWLALGEIAIAPVFLACSSGYVCLLVVEHYAQQVKQSLVQKLNNMI